jgi:5-methylthioadenosine/S-adenosylhomocysteine deaminase
MALQTDEFLISAKWVVPVIPEGLVLTDHSLLVQGSIINDILPRHEARKKYPDAKEFHLPDHLVTAGLINTHGHAAMTLLRGYADDQALFEWLNNHIWPVEAKLVSYPFVEDGTTLAVAEMISTGTTCAADSYFFPNAVASAFIDQHFRAQVCIPVIQHPNAWAKSEEEHIQLGLAFRDEVKDNKLINVAFAPHSPYTVTDKGFETLQSFTEEPGIPIHLHLHEARGEIESAFAESGKRPIQRMHELGLMTPTLQTIHMTQLEEDEIELLAANNVHVAHCPESNMKLASGFCEVDKLRKKGINVAIGTDSAASNNNLDMLEETRSATLLSKVLANDATSINAHEALSMATINGARLLGLDQKIGSLEKGKLADIIAVDFSAINFQPMHNPVSQLIYTATGHQVSHTWINGKLLYNDGEFTRLDVTRLRANVRQWQDKIGTIT